MTLIRVLRSLLGRFERRFERRGKAAYDPKADPDVRGFRAQRLQSVQAERAARRTGNPIADTIRPIRRGGQS